MSAAVLGVGLLVTTFALSAWRNINIGTLAFPAALLLGSYAGLSLEDQLAGFPAELFIVVVGITYLFGIAQANGTIDWILDGAICLLRGRSGLLPALMFLIAFALSSIGAVGTATLAMTLPIAMASAYRCNISPFMMAMITTSGMQAGYFSPNAVYSSTVVSLLENDGLEISRVGLFLNHAILNLAIAGLVWTLGRIVLKRRRVTLTSEPELVEAVSSAGASSGQSAAAIEPAFSSENAATTALADATTKQAGSRPFRIATLTALIALFFGVLTFDLDPGLLALSLGCVLMLVFSPGRDREYVEGISWSTVLMITGIITFVSTMQATGVLESLSNSLSHLGDASSGILAISYIAAIVSACASSIGTMGVVVPLASPLLLSNPDLSVLGATTTITASSYLVDPSPISILGVLVLANARESDRSKLFKQLTLWALAMVVLSPLVTWSLFVLL